MFEKKFVGQRSKLYKEAMKEFPLAREEEGRIAMQFLQPKPHERILEIGAGSGYFSRLISDVLTDGQLIATDPSIDQLEEIIRLGRKNIQVVQTEADHLTSHLPEETFDAIWCGGSFHHIMDKTSTFFQFFKLLKKGGRVVILDVFAGTSLSQHFDQEVAKYCITGHEVSFLTAEFAGSLCYLTGFSPPKCAPQNVHWKFASMQDLGLFLYKIHCMTKTTPDLCAKSAEEILGITYQDNHYCLNWPLTVLTTYKGA